MSFGEVVRLEAFDIGLDRFDMVQANNKQLRVDDGLTHDKLDTIITGLTPTPTNFYGTSNNLGYELEIPPFDGNFGTSLIVDIINMKESTVIVQNKTDGETASLSIGVSPVEVGDTFEDWFPLLDLELAINAFHVAQVNLSGFRRMALICAQGTPIILNGTVVSQD